MLHLRKLQKELPEAAKTISDNSYVDDIIDSVPNQEATKRTREIEEILSTRNLKIKEWTMTGTEKLNHNSARDQEGVKALTQISGNNSVMVNVLGMKWDYQKDNIMYDIKNQHTQLYSFSINNATTESISKRQILAIVNGIYNPLGLISPFRVRAKIIMRKLWTHKTIYWDDPIPESLQKEWQTFFKEIHTLKSLSFPRSTKPGNAIEKPDLDLFSDGSKEAYGAVAFTRWQTTDGSYKCRLVTSKNRIAPFKIVDIVRLELSGAATSERLRSTIEAETRLNLNMVYHIVDSKIVKAMINKESYGFSTFAANRIGEIQQSTQPNEWYWIKSSLNIADWLTSGKSPADINEGNIWQQGPQFLTNPVNE